MLASPRRRTLSAAAPALLLAGLIALLCLPGAARATVSATGTITATAGGARTATDTDAGYAAALGGVALQKAAWVSDPATAIWSALCTTDATGACSVAGLATGHYLVREAAAGAPAGWRALTQLAWGGGSAGASPTRGYVGDVTVTSATTVTVRPSTSWSPTAASSSSGRFVVAKDNPPLPARCGLDVLLLLDRSGSITAQRDTYRAAAKQFVSTLSATPTRLKIASFAADASADQSSFLDLDSAGSAAAANTKIDSVYNSTGGATNWDAGMRLAATAGVDVVVFITDGNPTLRDAPSSDTSGTTVNLLDLTAGIASANTIRAAGTTILAVGAGTGVTAENLAAVSGPDAGSDYVTSSIAGLDAKLQQIANLLCGARIHVRQLTDDGDPAVAKAGWTLTPGKPAGAVATLAPAAITTTGASADDVVAVDRIPAAGAPSITVTQSPAPGYAFVGSACRTGAFADVTSGGTATATIATVRRSEDWYCTFRSSHNGRIVVRQGTLPAGDPATFGYTTTATGTGTFTLGDGALDSRSVAPGTYTAAQVAKAGWALTSLACDDMDSAGSTASGNVTFRVEPGETVTCTYTNTKAGRVVVAQATLPGGDPATFGFTTTATGAGSFPLGDGATESRAVAPGTYTFTQSDKPGWNLTDLTCDDADSTTSTASGVASIRVAPGETVTCTYTNTKNGTLIVAEQTTPAADPTRFDFVTGGAGDAFKLADGETEPRSVVPGDYTVTEARTTGYRLTDVTCDAGGDGSAQTRTASFAIAPGETVTCTFHNKLVSVQPAVVKGGPEYAYHGDTLSYTFVVTNPGAGDLHAVHVSDDGCAPTTLAGQKDAASDPDATPDVLDIGDVWTYVCSTPMPAHDAAELNPETDTVSVAALDEFDRAVTSTDHHSTRILHPAVAIDKTGPATAQAGTAVAYGLAVTNSGDVPFLAANVNVGDVLCEAPPALVSTNGDTTAGQLDPGDDWSYTCTVRSLVGQTQVANIGVVSAIDSFGGHTVSAHDQVTTTLTAPPVQIDPTPPASPTPPAADPTPPASPTPPAADPLTPPSATPPASNPTSAPAGGAGPAAAPVAALAPPAAIPARSGVLAGTAASATARLSGPSRCVSAPFTVSVRGTQISRVGFMLDAKQRSTVKAKSGRKLFSLRIDPRHQGFGVHRLSALVRFTAASDTSARTLRLVYQRCPKSAVKPSFTG